MEHTRLHEVFDSIFDPFKPIHKMVELKSLWVSEDRKRYKVGDMVYLDKSMDSWTVDTNAYTHKIVKLMGTLDDKQHEITFEDLTTGELTTIKL